MFSRYQSTLANFETVFSEQKTLALPKKKFAFKRKAKASAPSQPKAAQVEEQKLEAGQSKVDQGNHLLIKN